MAIGADDIAFLHFCKQPDQGGPLETSNVGQLLPTDVVEVHADGRKAPAAVHTGDVLGSINDPPVTEDHGIVGAHRAYGTSYHCVWLLWSTGPPEVAPLLMVGGSLTVVSGPWVTNVTSDICHGP